MIKVGFLLTTDVVWNCFSALYHEMKKSPEFDVVVISGISSYDVTNSNKNTPWMLNGMHQENTLKSLEIPYLSTINCSAEDRKNKILSEKLDIIITSAKDEYFFKILFDESVLELSNRYKMIYIPYYGATQVKNETIHVSTPMHSLAWRIIVDSEIYADYLERNDFPADRIINIGHPKIQEIYNIRKLSGKWPLNGDSRLKVIWAPHWSVLESKTWHDGAPNVLKFGTFLDNHLDFLEYARNNNDVQFVFRPHPILPSWLKLHNSYDIYSDFLIEWEKLDNTVNVLTGLYNDIFAGSDILVTDGISFLLEYPIATEKPVIFIDNRIHNEFNEIGLLGEQYANVCHSFNEVKQFLNNPLSLQKNSANPILDRILPNRENTAELITKSIYEAYMNEK